MEGQGDECLETTGLSLQIAKPAEVVNAVSGLLDVAVEHGCVGPQTKLMGLTVNAHPSSGIGLVLANLVAHFWMENLGAATGQTAETGLSEFGQQVARRPAGQAR